MNAKHIEVLKKMGACKNAIYYAETKKTPLNAWVECTNLMWLLWWLEQQQMNETLPRKVRNEMLTTCRLVYRLTRRVDHLILINAIRDLFPIPPGA